MPNIPTELLRALVTVVDLGSYTKASQALGLTQPAVSGQLRRLQEMIDGELFDRTVSGVNVTGLGQAVVTQARRLLSINDRLLELAAHHSSTQVARIGVPWDFGQASLATVLAEHRRRWPGQRFAVRGDSSDNLLRLLRQGDLDIAVAFTELDRTTDALRQWSEQIAWVRGPDSSVDPARPVPLVTHCEGSVLNRVSTAALARASLDWDVVLVAPSTLSLGSAVAAGLGFAATARRFIPPGLVAWDDGPLPRLADVFCGVYLRESIDEQLLARIADAIVADLRPAPPLNDGSRRPETGAEIRAAGLDVNQEPGGKSRGV